jgi:N-acetylmuramoyl-L-alanine amidase
MHSQDYGISFYEGSSQKDGVKCLVMFNPDKIGFEYKMFESITGAKGIMFEFHDQKKLKNLSVSTVIKRNAFLKKPKVILDFGHGGRDGGFSNDYVQEKEINRQVGLKVASLLKKKGMQVCLTRKGDEYLSLDQRTAATRSCKDAQLLVSIHSNASTHKGAHGIETFCNHGSLFKTGQSFMNNTVGKHAYDFNKSLNKRSNILAKAVHSNVLGYAKSKNKYLKDRKVKHNVAQLLIGSELPSVLIELGFLSHEREGKLLQTDAYQFDLAKGICAGIETYLEREVA